MAGMFGRSFGLRARGGHLVSAMAGRLRCRLRLRRALGGHLVGIMVDGRRRLGLRLAGAMLVVAAMLRKRGSRKRQGKGAERCRAQEQAIVGEHVSIRFFR
jgi:hypothetical protein